MRYHGLGGKEIHLFTQDEKLSNSFSGQLFHPMSIFIKRESVYHYNEKDEEKRMAMLTIIRAPCVYLLQDKLYFMLYLTFAVAIEKLIFYSDNNFM